MSEVWSGEGSASKSRPPAETPLPPDSWPGAQGQRSVAPQVPSWPGAGPDRSENPGESWPGARPSTATTPDRGNTSGRDAREEMVDLDDDALRDLHLRRPAHQVSPKAKMAWRISACIAWIFPIIGVGVWIFFDDDPTRRLWQYGVAAVIGLWALFSIVVVPWWRFKVHRWEVTDTAVHTQAGWLHQERRVAPISRIQTVDSEFGPIEQLIGLGTLTVTTASAAGELRVSGLDKETVQRLVADLTRITAKERGDAT